MKTKIQLLLIALMVGVAVNVSAQETKSASPEEIAKKETEVMTKHLSLTSDQQTKVEAINLKYSKQCVEAKQKLKSGQKLTEEQKKELKAEIKKGQDAKDVELKGVLTADQNKKYLEEKENIIKKIEAEMHK